MDNKLAAAINAAILHRAPTMVDRLIALAAHLDIRTGRYRYRDESIRSRYPDHVIDECLRRHHCEAFAIWLSYSFSKQCSEVLTFSSSADTTPDVLLRNWLDRQVYDILIPGVAGGFERELYRLEFRAVLTVLLQKRGGLPVARLSVVRDRRVRRLLQLLTTGSQGEFLSVNQLALSLGISASRFRVLCRTELGLNPTQCIKLYRMRNAAELLRTTELSIKSIADRLGYSHSSNLIHDFRKLFALTPRAYRLGHSPIGPE